MTKISTNEYQKICNEIQKQITQTTQNIFNSITRQKVEMAWNIGKIVDKSLRNKDEKTYGKTLIKKLEGDVKISETALYKMRSFYKAYPKLPKDDVKLNWSHYRVLSGVKEASERKALEYLARENLWDSDRLQKEVTRRKTLPAGEETLIKKSTTKKIQPNRGRIYAYQIVEIAGAKSKFVDCGFKIFREAQERLPKDAKVVLVSQKNQKYSYKKSSVTTKQLYLYKACLKRVVDGDTIHANIDLGFGIWHEEILRFAKINAAENSTTAGKQATVELNKIFATVDFFVVKSIKTDIYNRYVTDIFLPRGKETDLQKICDDGIYLNQLLLDRGLAELF